MQYTLEQLQALGLPAVRVWDEDMLGIIQTQAEFERPLTEAELVTFMGVTEPDKANIKREYLSTIATLEQIETTVNPTNAQIIAAVKFLATTLKLLLKLVARTL